VPVDAGAAPDSWHAPTYSRDENDVRIAKRMYNGKKEEHELSVYKGDKVTVYGPRLV
jgi:hypothetical protein